MKRFLIPAFAICLCMGSAHAQNTPIVSGAVTLQVLGGQRVFTILLNQNVTSFSINAPGVTDGTALMVAFTQNSTGGYTVGGYASNIQNSGAITIKTSPGAISTATIIYSAYSNVWAVVSGGGGGGSMTWPSAAGVACYSGSSSWCNSYGVGTAANDLVQLNGSGQLPAVSAANLTNFPATLQSALSTYSAPSNEFITGFTAPNTFSAAQPLFSNLSGTIGAAQIAASPVNGDCPYYNGSVMGWTACGGGAGFANWSQNGTTGTVSATTASAQDAPIQQFTQQVNGGSADLTQWYLNGATPSNNCASNSKCVASIGPGGLYVAANSFTLGTVNQSSASYMSLFGGTPAQPYIVMGSAALNPPAQPTVTDCPAGDATPPCTGASGSLSASTTYTIEVTYLNGAGETTVSTAQTVTTGAASTDFIVVTSPTSSTNATSYHVYMKQSGSYYLQNGAGGTTLGTNAVVTSFNNSAPSPPSSNTTGGLYSTYLSMSAEGSGVLCSSSSVPGVDCASGTQLVQQSQLAFSNLSGTIAATQIAASPVTNDCPQYNGSTMIWASCSGGGGTWNTIGNPTGNQTLTMGAYTTNWNSSSTGPFFNIQQSTPATSGANFDSPQFSIGGTVYSGSSQNSVWTFQDIPPASGTGFETLKVSNTGPDTGVGFLLVSGLQVEPASGFSGLNIITANAPSGYNTSNNLINAELNGTSVFTVRGGGTTYIGDHLTFGSNGSHIQQNAANQDIAGTIAISAATSGSHTFSVVYASAPSCTLSPTSNPGSTTWWVTTSTTAVTANLSTSATITFDYICIGNPN